MSASYIRHQSGHFFDSAKTILLIDLFAFLISLISSVSMISGTETSFQRWREMQSGLLGKTGSCFGESTSSFLSCDALRLLYLNSLWFVEFPVQRGGSACSWKGWGSDKHRRMNTCSLCGKRRPNWGQGLSLARNAGRKTVGLFSVRQRSIAVRWICSLGSCLTVDEGWMSTKNSLPPDCTKHKYVEARCPLPSLDLELPILNQSYL